MRVLPVTVPFQLFITLQYFSPGVRSYYHCYHHHLSDADRNSEANQLSPLDAVDSVGVLASSSRFCITPSDAVEVPASTRFSGMLPGTSRAFPGTCRMGSLGGLDGLCMAAAPPAEPRLLLPRLPAEVAALPMLLLRGMAPAPCCNCSSLSLLAL